MSEILVNLFTVDVLIGLLVGVIGGMIIGALPGLSASMGVALMIPITYGMEPVAALVMLTSIYTAAIYGGSFTAILIHTPGTPSSAATARDGYELTKQGRGLEAIGWSTTASVFGGFLSGIALFVIAPPLAKFALRFSSPEYFFIALFGLTIIGSLAGDSPLKGVMSGIFGLIIGLIGMEANTAYARFTFGSIQLQAGIQLIPAMIGLFSISQIMVQAERLSSKSGLSKGQILDKSIVISGKFLPTIGEFVRALPNLIRSTILGILIGILPGAGGDIACWVSYNEAKRVSKHKEMFGKGSVEGIIASEAANNAVTGGAFIPLLTLGVPGSGTAAILMGGLLIQGLTPGNSLFTKNAHIIYPIMIGFIVANLLMGVFGILSAKYAARIAEIPMNILSPIIVVLAIVGSYAIRMNMFDVYVMMVFGFIGYFMRKSGFPTAPIVLALILGPMAEKGFFSSISMAKGNVWVYFFKRPISMVFLALTIVSLFAPILIKRVKKGEVNKPETVGSEVVFGEED
ncbi:MAG TPA: tripartite tricarboxylate transporter permease [Bacillota bacterium]|nr:tripartite tricarboxylate transporter permease [Bacillota bacterium]